MARVEIISTFGLEILVVYLDLNSNSPSTQGLLVDRYVGEVLVRGGQNIMYHSNRFTTDMRTIGTSLSAEVGGNVISSSHFPETKSK